MIQMTNLSSYDDDAIHLHKSNEIETLDLITTPLNPLTILVVEDASNGFIKKKITIGELESGISDLDAIHLHKDNEISTLEPAPIIFDHTSLVVIEDAADNYSKKKIAIDKLVSFDEHIVYLNIGLQFGYLPHRITPDGSDRLLLEDSSDNFKKKYLTFDFFSIETISDGTIFKKYLNDERIKLSAIEPLADVTDIDNVTVALNYIPVYELEDISSTGLEIEDAVLKKHIQNTDTSLGILDQNIDFSDFTGINVSNPVNDNDIATLVWVENGLATKQDVLTNNIGSLSIEEVAQLNNIGANIITPTDWANLAKSGAGFRTVFTSTTADTYYCSFMEPLTNTIDEFGYYHFMIKYDDNTGLNFELYEVSILVPSYCFYDMGSNPPFVKIRGGRRDAPSSLKSILTTSMDSYYNFAFFIEFECYFPGAQISLYDFDDSTIQMGDSSHSCYNSVIPYNVNHTLNFSPSREVSTNDKYGAVGIDQTINLNIDHNSVMKVYYSSPVISSRSFFPESAPSKDIYSFYSTNQGYSDLFMVNPVLGQPQHWRIVVNVNIKNIDDTIELVARMFNPVNNDLYKKIATIPSGVMSLSYIVFDFTLNADESVLSSVNGGNGAGGYNIFFSIISPIDSDMIISIKSIFRMNS